MFNEPTHAGKEPWLALYRQRVLHFHGLAPSQSLPPPPKAHTLILVQKDGRRGIHNFDEALAYLRGGCAGLCAGVFAQIRSTTFHTLTIREQLQLVSTATIAISPPGGCSMVLPFLPEGAHAILINYMLSAKEANSGAGPNRKLRGAEGICAKCSLTMEASLWRHTRHVRKLYYQVWAPSDFARGRPGRDAAVVLQMPRLGYLVRAALDSMASRYTRHE